MEKSSKYKWIAANSIILLTKEMNRLGIKKSDIVSLIYNEQYILVYTE